MSEFGLYFGTKQINITEVKGKKALVNIYFPNKSDILGLESVQKQKETIAANIANNLKDEFAKNDIFPNAVNIALAGENLIIRTFDIPIFVSKKELEYNAIAFEARKYIPFKTEDLVFNFQIFPDRKEKKYLVLFVGIKRQLLDLYLAIFQQLQLKIKLVEYAGFGILRLLSLGGVKEKGTFGLLNVDLEEESNFLVCQSGFPLFSRDITLVSKQEAEAKTDFIGILKGELRISLDFFRRKFTNKDLKRLVILSPADLQGQVVALIKELGLTPIAVNTSKFLGMDFEFTGTLAKSYATAISSSQRVSYSINLLKPAIKKKAKAISLKALPVDLGEIGLNPKVVLAALLIVVLAFGFSLLKRKPIEDELKLLKSNEPRIAGVPVGMPYSTIASSQQDYSKRLNQMSELVKDRFYLTKALDIIPKVLPPGAWLTRLNSKTIRDKSEFTIEGMVFLSDPNREFLAVNDIVAGLRSEPVFSERFNEIAVVSMERYELVERELELTKFNIVCR